MHADTSINQSRDQQRRRSHVCGSRRIVSASAWRPAPIPYREGGEMTAEQAKQNHYLAINLYRSSTGEGFANTWRIIRVASRAIQQRILAEGLPISDTWYRDEEGRDHPICSTMGIRLATAEERAQLRREIEMYGEDAFPVESTSTGILRRS